MSLVSLCIQTLIPFADQIQLPFRLHLRSHSLIWNELIPDPANVDPRLWAVLIQIYDSLPPYFASHSLSLADAHLPLLQSIQSTQSFSLITLLDLPNCPHLTDRTIIELRFVNTLTAFDATHSSLSPYAIRTLTSFKGSWQLRILSLRKCRHITNDVFPHLIKFPLLSVLDLRGTRCNTHNTSLLFQPSSHDFYYPSPLKAALTTLHSLHPDLYSSSKPYHIHINALASPTHRPKIATVTPQDGFFVFPSDNSKIQVGSSHLLEEREKELTHQHNKDAWYKRQDLLESLTNYSIDPNLTLRLPRRAVSLEKRVPSISCITNSSWIGTSRTDPQKQIKPGYSLPLPSRIPPKSIPQVDATPTKPFYTLLPKKSLLPSRTRSFHDGEDHLKLYRPAPPWSTLKKCLTQAQVEETAAMVRREQDTRTIPPEDVIARVDMSSTKATLMKRQLDEWTLAQTQIRRDEKERTMDVRVAEGETSLLSRNPFRRQRQEMTKPLKPISTVRKPILTPQVRRAALGREAMEAGLNLKRKRIAEKQEEGEESDEGIKSGPRPSRSSRTSSRGFNWKEWSKNAS